MPHFEPEAKKYFFSVGGEGIRYFNTIFWHLYKLLFHYLLLFVCFFFLFFG